MKRLPSVQKNIETPTQIIRKSKKIRQISLKIEVWRGPRASWEGSWGHSGPQGCSRSEKYSKIAFVYPSPRDQVGGQNWHFADLVDVILRLIFRQALGKASGSIFHGFWIVFWCFFDIFLEFVSGLLHKWKCDSDTLFIMFEAHCRYGKYAKNVIKSYTFQGRFSEWLRERILAPFSLILDSFWRAWGFPKWPNSHPRADQKNVGQKEWWTSG